MHELDYQPNPARMNDDQDNRFFSAFKSTLSEAVQLVPQFHHQSELLDKAIDEWNFGAANFAQMLQISEATQHNNNPIASTSTTNNRTNYQHEFAGGARNRQVKLQVGALLASQYQFENNINNTNGYTSILKNNNDRLQLSDNGSR